MSSLFEFRAEYQQTKGTDFPKENRKAKIKKQFTCAKKTRNLKEIDSCIII